MSTRAKLPVFEVVEEAFKFAWRKLPALLILTITTSILIFLPIFLIVLALTLSDFGLFSLFDATSTAELETAVEVTPVADWTLGVSVVLFAILIILAVSLYYSIIISQIIRSVMYGERLWLIRINRNTFRYLLAIVVVMLLSIPVLVLASAPIGIGVYLTDATDIPEGLILAPAILVALMILVFFFSRLWLVPVDIVTRAKFAIAHGFKAGRSNAWRLFGVFIVVAITTNVIMLVSLLILLPLSMLSPVTLAPEAIETIETDPAILVDLFSASFTAPFAIAYSVLSTLIQTLLLGVTYSAPVFAYRHLIGSNMPTETEAI